MLSKSSKTRHQHTQNEQQLFHNKRNSEYYANLCILFRTGFRMAHTLSIIESGKQSTYSVFCNAWQFYRHKYAVFKIGKISPSEIRKSDRTCQRKVIVREPLKFSTWNGKRRVFYYFFFQPPLPVAGNGERHILEQRRGARRFPVYSASGTIIITTVMMMMHRNKPRVEGRCRTVKMTGVSREKCARIKLQFVEEHLRLGKRG